MKGLITNDWDRDNLNFLLHASPDVIADWNRVELENGALEKVAKLDLASRPKVKIADYRIGSPVARPTKVICVGLNYAKHAKETGMAAPAEPVIFMKAPDTVIGPNDEVMIPRDSVKTDWEVELAIVIGAVAKNVTEANAPDVIWGFTIANDVSARDLQASDVQWMRAKGFDTFCPLGPWIETDFVPGTQRIFSKVNDEIRQDATLDQMIFSVADIVVFVSQIMTLLPGDVIITGTPAGIGPLIERGNVVVGIDGLGQLTNKVSAKP